MTQNRSMSACLGIPTQKVDALTFALGSGLAGVAGCAISLLGSVGPNTGQNYIVDTFMVVVVGVGKVGGQYCRGDRDWYSELSNRFGDARSSLYPDQTARRFLYFFCHHEHGKGDGVCPDYCFPASTTRRHFPSERTLC